MGKKHSVDHVISTQLTEMGQWLRLSHQLSCEMHARI
jgi:hypothetical protein